MYQPRLFREEDPARLHELIDARSFGTLLAVGPGGEPEISHLPFLLDRDVGRFGRLRVHVARANPIWEIAMSAGRLTAIFAGPHAYVSPSWYEAPTEQVPTWNYAVVHAHGTPTEMNRDQLIELLDDLVAVNERGSTTPWNTGLLIPSLRDELLLEIVGLSVEITKLEGKFKLSQNRSAADRERVVAALCRRGTVDDAALVDLMTPRE